MVNWKVLAIVFIILFTLETSFIVWSTYLVISETNKTNDCFYNICGDYPDAGYDAGVCYCYDYSLLGEMEVVKTIWMNK